MPDEGALVQGRYRVVRLLSRGGMGAVYEAVDERLHCTVALKKTLFDAEPLQKQFEREARILARLRHPALTKVIDHFAGPEGQFLVMEFIPGHDLHAQIKERGRPFPIGDVLTWSDQLLDALDYLHGQEPPVIHRDIKPQNLKLTGRNEIVLLDFGLAKDSAGAAGSTTTASLYGYTPNYAPLEQVQGTGTDGRSDLYSFGATIYELLTGIMPPDSLARAAAAIGGEADPLRPPREINPEVPPEVSAAILDSMQLHRDRRPASARELRSKMGRSRSREEKMISETAPTLVEPGEQRPERAGTAPPTVITDNAGVTPPTLLEPARKRSLAWTVTAALLLLLLLGGTAAMWLRSRNGGEPREQALSPAAAAVPPPQPDTGPSQPSERNDSFLLEGATEQVNAVATSPDGSTIATGSDDGSVILWEASSRRRIRELKLPGSVSSVAFAPDGRTIAVGVSYSPSLNKSLARVIDLSTGDAVRDWTGVAGLVSDVDWSRRGRIAFADGSRVRLADPREEGERTLDLHSVSASVLSFSSSGDLLASGGVDGKLIVWDTATAKPVRTFEIANGVRGVAFSPDGRWLAGGGYDETLRIYDLRSGDARSVAIPALLNAVAYSPDGRLLAVAPNVPGRIDLLAVPGYTTQRTLTGDQVSIRDLAFSPDSRLLVSTSAKAARVWVLGP